MKIYNIGIIGCGLIGRKRADGIKKLKFCNIKYCSDSNLHRLNNFKKNYKSKSYLNWKDLIKNNDLDVVFVCTTHNLLAKITQLAIKKNIHVFCEKPGGVSFKEIIKVKKTYESNKNLSLYYGFNHIWHPAFLKLQKLISKNRKKIGSIMYVKASYGHGGRLNYDKEWRFKKELSGGGELIDKGSHLINLGLYYLGDLVLLKSYLRNFYWKITSDDNAFLLLENKKKNLFFLHASCTEWKNKFIFEMIFENSKFIVEGLGASYGTEKLKYYQMKKKMGKPPLKEWKFEKNDKSWKREIDYFFNSIKKENFISNINITVKTMKIISDAYTKKIK